MWLCDPGSPLLEMLLGHQSHQHMQAWGGLLLESTAGIPSTWLWRLLLPEAPGGARIQGHAFPTVFPWKKLQSTCRLPGRSWHGTSALVCHSPREGPGIPSLADTATVVYYYLGPALPQAWPQLDSSPDMGMVHGFMVETKKAPIAAWYWAWPDDNALAP